MSTTVKEWIFAAALVTLFAGLVYGNTPSTAEKCANAKAKMELLDLCDKQKACIYDMPELKDTVRSLAACELAKVN